jgi:cellulose synthase/poly-beta-1,6-N-acetylglucosamine synthase-like glycosyltransferase
MMSSMTPEVCVLLPYRDAVGTLEEALDSVLSQQGVRFEVIAVDDGSRDAGPALVHELAARHAQLRATSIAAAGIVAALQHAASLAQAPLLARMDADDVCLPERLQLQREAFARDSQLAALGTQVEAFDAGEVGAGMQRYVAWQNGLLSADDHRREIFVESPLCHPSVVMRRDAFEAVGGYRDGPFPEDYELWLRLDRAGHAIAKLPQVLLRWRQGDARATVTDPRYAHERFVATKAPFLATRLQQVDRPLTVWGAGRTGRRLMRALEAHGLRADRFVDIDEAKIGRTARGVPIVSPDGLAAPGAHWVLVAVRALGARQLIRAELDRRGHREGLDYLCAA